jgi:hypothetical protein
LVERRRLKERYQFLECAPQRIERADWPAAPPADRLAQHARADGVEKGALAAEAHRPRRPLEFISQYMQRLRSGSTALISPRTAPPPLIEFERREGGPGGHVGVQKRTLRHGTLSG